MPFFNTTDVVCKDCGNTELVEYPIKDMWERNTGESFLVCPKCDWQILVPISNQS